MYAEDQPEGLPGAETPDPREKPRTGVTVIRLRRGKLSVETVAPLLVHCAGLYRPDAAAVCAQGGGILADNIAPAQAQALVEALQQLGEPCFAAPAAEVAPLPRAVPIHAARLTQTDLGPLDTVGRQQQAPWEKAIALVLAGVAVVEEERKPRPPGNMLTRHLAGSYGGLLEGAIEGVPRDTIVRTTEQRVWLDVVFLQPLRRYRIDSGQFDYSVLGKQLATTGAANVQTLARWFLSYAPQVRTNVDVQTLQRQGTVPLAHLQEKTINEMVHWLINLARFGKEPERAV